MQHEVTDVRAALQLALEHRQAGRLAQATELCARVVSAAPRHEGARLLLGVLALEDDRAGDAEAAFRAAVALAPNLAPAHLNLGLALRRLGRPGEAVSSYDRALELSPGSAEIQNSRGVALLDLGRFDEALASFGAALATAPTFAAARGNQGLALLGLERPVEALASFEAALAAAPHDAALLQGKADALMGVGRPDLALGAYDAAIATSPGHVAAVVNRATALTALDRPHDALAGWDAAIALRPDDPMLWFERANALGWVGRLHDAIDAFDQVAQARPDFRDAVYNRGLARLALADFRRGWQDYEARWDVPAFVRTSASIPDALRARFDPMVDVADLAGRRILVVAEQGVGDIIMFASMLPDLAAIAEAVTFSCEARFQRLMSRSFPNVRVCGSEEGLRNAAAHDHVLPIGSLGRLFRNDREAFPGVRYLSASPEVRAQWAERLGRRGGQLRVGISWRGGLKRTRRDQRSFPLQMLGPILDLPNCEFVSLQHGDAAAEIDAENTRRDRPVRRFASEEIDDFEELAGLVQSLDLVVSVQTAVVHLAGALGVPCLAMTPVQSGWRYPAAAPRMHWYETVKVFRQASAGDWDPVIEQVAREVSSIRAPNP